MKLGRAPSELQYKIDFSARRKKGFIMNLLRKVFRLPWPALAQQV
jgi:hypothetical protein